MWATAPAPSGLAGGGTIRTDNLAASRAGQYTQEQRFVAGRTFFQNGTRWVDSEVQRQKPGVQRVRLSFGSAEYFDLIRRHAEAAPWLALGQNVDLILDGIIYEISEATAGGGAR